MKKCLVLGGAGFLGSSLVNSLLAAGHGVRVFDRATAIENLSVIEVSELVEYVSGDFTDSVDIEKALDGIEVVYHLISTTLPQSSNEDMQFDVNSNVISTLKLLELMVAKNIKRIIFSSSGGTVYGLPQTPMLDENHQTKPICSYGITKLAIENYLYLFKRLYGLEPIIFRVSNPYGAGQRVDRPQGVIAAFIQKALTEQEISIWGDGSVIRDYIYISDVADAFVRAIDYTGGEILFNLGSGHGVSLNEIVADLSLLIGRSLNVRYYPSRSFDVPCNILSVEKIWREFGWEAAISLHDGLALTINWIKSETEKTFIL
ncbi:MULTISPECIES: NAD-dependent epimerase/dehydratase family protein [Deefgea]|uniref:NAD-dependent epimerase/dehydratase family protein n=1 Tax=Deefgea chitinilytica TaxID=570276 RepID=A0ABS2C774_9NEIS|nr:MULTISPECIES: NAD-dependent epimerase/dehydratase family protein [Deefgea]MBM5570019.1 NAD-dependent epimerase/dehydratase family protein [Deefgea chitinilytica]MBM9887248.1 NAD-dependent epimerase/dehydratase family protein [Deefgea sp. CFH1-16]